MRFMQQHPAVAAVLSAAAVVTIAGSAHAQNARDELPIPSSPQQDLTAIQRAFSPPAPPRLKVFPRLWDDMKDLPAFIRESTFDINFRSYYRDVVTNNPTACRSTRRGRRVDGSASKR